ncbi:MAG: TfoX/Sxy family protein [Thermoplasmata archaeon]
MKFAAPAASTVRDFEALLPSAPGVTSKMMFGQPAAVVNGHLFFGVFGNQLFVRLSDADRSEAGEIPGFLPFEPMPGRAMREYLILPTGWRSAPSRSRPWVARALRYASSLSPKTPKARSK